MEMSTKKLELILEDFNVFLKENIRILNEKSAETDRVFKEKLAENERAFQEKLAENERLFKEKSAETDRLFKETHREIGGISKSNGEIAEEYFYNSFINRLHFAGQEYDSIASNLNKKIKNINLECEFDLVLYNCSSVAIIEVKYDAEKKHIARLLKKPQIFKQLFPEYANFDIYLGLAGLSIKKEAEIEAKEKGIAVIKQVGENMVVYDEGLRVF